IGNLILRFASLSKHGLRANAGGEDTFSIFYLLFFICDLLFVGFPFSICQVLFAIFICHLSFDPWRWASQQPEENENEKRQWKNGKWKNMEMEREPNRKQKE